LFNGFCLVQTEPALSPQWVEPSGGFPRQRRRWPSLRE
jgi:hypothetical protein